MDFADLVPAVTAEASRLRPLQHFLVLGVLLFGAKQWLQPREVIEAPTLAAAQEEMLVREALRLGLERSDPIVRTRLTLNMRFVEGAAGLDDALFERALALGMAGSDVVARRRLVEAMHERFAAGIDVDESDLRDYVARHAGRYGTRARISFEQQQLEGRSVLLATRVTEATEAEIARSFGPDFARAVMAQGVGESIDIRSPYGLHRVRVLGVTAGEAPVFESVRRQARYALLAEREHQAAAEAMRALRRRYELRVPATAMASAQ